VKVKSIFIVLVLLVVLFSIGCTTFAPPGTDVPPGSKATGLLGFKQLDDSKSTSEGLSELVLANNKFAVDYYTKLDSNPKYW